MPRSVPTPCDISEPYIGRAGYLASEWGQDTVSVHRPGFYAQRFMDFMSTKIFEKIPSCKHLSRV